MEKHIEFVTKIINSSEFYKRKYKREKFDYNKAWDFSCIPVLTKQQIHNEWINTQAKVNDKSDIVAVETSGTTGIPLKVLWTKKEYIQSNFYTWKLRLKWYKITPSMRYCTFHSCLASPSGIQKNDAVVLNEGRTLSLGRYVYYYDLLSEYVNLINEFEAEWILGPPSVICLISQYMINNKKSLKKIKYIEFNGEFVENHMIELVKKAFPGVLISNLYGSSEFNGIALTCPRGKMHLINNNVYVETIVKDEMSTLYITGLVNTLMPFIRYQIGDLGQIEYGTCPCGCSGPFLKLKRGREKELIQLKNDYLFDPSSFNSVIHLINRKKPVIEQYRFIVRSATQIEILLLLTDGDWDCNHIAREVRDACLRLNSTVTYIVCFAANEMEMYNRCGKLSLVTYEEN